MFELFAPPDLSSRFRGAAAVPFAAFLVSQIYFTLIPIIGVAPAMLFYGVDVVLLLGGLIGLTRIASILYRGRNELDVRSAGWLVMALLVTGVTLRFFLALTFPWL